MHTHIWTHVFPLFAFIYKWYNTKTLFYFVSIAAAVAIFHIDYEHVVQWMLIECRVFRSFSPGLLSECQKWCDTGKKTLYDEFWASGKNSSDELPNGTYA